MTDLYIDPVKNSIVLFLSAFLIQAIQNEESNKYLFEFVYDSISLLNLLETGKGNFHLFFLIKTTEFLGFRINRETYIKGSVFDLLEGRFSNSIPFHTHYISPDESYELYYILSSSFSEISKLNIDRDKRNRLLNIVLEYYNLHVPGISNIKSFDILKTLFI